MLDKSFNPCAIKPEQVIISGVDGASEEQIVSQSVLFALGEWVQVKLKHKNKYYVLNPQDIITYVIRECGFKEND